MPDALFGLAYVQNLDPLGHRVLSTIVAALPVVVLFYLLVGRRWLASRAGAAGSAVAILIAWLVYGMPPGMAAASWAYGAAFGLLPIGWTVFGAMALYNLTVETGQFAIIRRSIGSLSGDARVQAVLIGFCFGALMEGAAGSGAPVAICGAMLVGLGVPAFRAAVICLIANTSPVCFGGLGVPILTLGNVTGIPPETISVMCGHQLPFLSCLIPFYMVKVMCPWRQTFAVWPALVVGGGSFAVCQYAFATMHTWVPGLNVWPLTDIGASIFSLVALSLFLKFVWRPKHEWKFAPPADKPVAVVPDGTLGHGVDVRAALRDSGPTAALPLTPWVVARAWSPFAVMAVCLAGAGAVRQYEAKTKSPVTVLGVASYYEFAVPSLHFEVERADRLQKLNATDEEKKEKAVYRLAWLTAPGTPVFAAAVLSAILLGATSRQFLTVLRKTLVQMKVPIPTIAFMLGLSYVTKYSGIDATLGVAFAETGVLYPFFAAMLGWLGVFLTGTDAGSNALFGSLQQITAGQVYESGAFSGSDLTRGQAETLICTANSTGGVMGKMIDAQSICVATAGTNQIGKEADLFKAVIGHSIFLAAVVGTMTMLQAYVWPFTMMVP